MSKIKEHFVRSQNGTQPLLEWLDGAKCRLYDLFNESKQLELAKEIAGIEDKNARDLALKLLKTAGGLRDQIVEAKEEFKTLHDALTKIDAAIDSQNID